MHIFYCTHITTNQAFLSREESIHCIRVLRLSRGDKVRLIDGHGGMFDAVITQPDVKQCKLEIFGTVNHQNLRSSSLHIAIAPTKNMERFEWFVEKAVEIGVDIITPLLCQRSERRALKTERIQRLIVSTMKQAMVPFLPVLNELTDYNQFITTFTGSSFNRFIAHYVNSPRKSLKQALSPKSNVIVLIGPEGDFTSGEIDLAIINGFVPVSLGNNRLRTETAGIVVCQTVNLINE